MALKAEQSLIIGLATAAVVYAVYQANLPTTAAVRASEADNKHIDTSRITATWESAAIVGGISLMAKDPTIFVIGGAVIVFLDFSHRHANATDKVSGKLAGTVSSSGVSASAEVTG